MAVKPEMAPESSLAPVQYLIAGRQILAAAFFGDTAVCKLKEKCLT